jgi:hypothetical protein
VEKLQQILPNPKLGWVVWPVWTVACFLAASYVFGFLVIEAFKVVGLVDLIANTNGALILQTIIYLIALGLIFSLRYVRKTTTKETLGIQRPMTLGEIGLGVAGYIIYFIILVGAPAATEKWLGHMNQYVIDASGGGNAMEYRATAIEGDFVGEADLILRGEGYPDENGNIVEARIKLDSSQGKSILDLQVINWSTGKPATSFELAGVGNFTFQQYLLLNVSQREALDEEDFCESLDRILPRDFSGVYIAPHGKKLTAGADLVADDAVVDPVKSSAFIGRFAAEQANLDEYRAAHPEEFEEK